MITGVWLGIDFGTSGCRICAIDNNAKIVFQTRTSFVSNQPYPDPLTQWQIVFVLLQKTVAALKTTEINAISVAATSGSVLIADKSGEPMSEMLLYNDKRADTQSQKIAEIAPSDSAAHGATSGLAKLLYLQQKTALPAQYYLAHQTDWLLFKLGARPAVTDYNSALKSGFDPVSLSWPEWLTKVVSQSVLPEVVAPGTVIGQMPANLMTDLKLKQNTPPNIIAGTTDSLAAFIATGASKIGDGVTSLGSTLVLKLICQRPVFAPEYGVYSHKLGHHWLLGGASNSGGAVLKQYFNNQQLNQLSKQINLNVTPPDYYPLPSIGERFPIAEPQMLPRLTPRPASDSLFLHGLLNGVANIEQSGYAKLQQLGGTKLQTLRSIGGGAANQLWTKIRQQKLAMPFLPVLYSEAAYGAALLGKDGLTAFNEVNDG